MVQDQINICISLFIERKKTYFKANSKSYLNNSLKTFETEIEFISRIFFTLFIIFFFFRIS